MKSKIIFGDEKLKQEFEELKAVKENKLYNQLSNAFKNLQEDAFCGIQIPKSLIPKEYTQRFGALSNLWKYDLPNVWRLIYTIIGNEVKIVSVILEWMDHKNYERRFGY